MRKEIIEKRGFREKHFLIDEGLIEAVLYDDIIHYKDNNKYFEINNSLIRKNNGFENIDNSLNVLFEERSSNKLVTISKENTIIKMGLKNSLERVSDKYLYDMFGELDKNKKLNDEINYYNVLDGVDISYQLTPNKLKEKIILKNKFALNNKFIFNLETDLTLLLKEDKSISLQKDNCEYFIIEAPFMIDNSGSLNNNIYYIINKNKIGYELSLILDDEWLNDETRKFPIIIDPTITTEDINSLQDTYISNKDKDTNFNDKDYLSAGVFNNGDEICRSLIKFNLPIIGTGSSIIDARLHLIGLPELHPYGWYDSNIVNVYPITESWNEETATWNNMHNKYIDIIEEYQKFWFSRFEINYDIIPVTTSFNITNLVKRWYSGMENNGLMLKSNKEVYIEDQYNAKYFSKNNAVQGYNPKPVVSITYRNQNGLEVYMTYQEQTLTHGNIYLNNYNGNLTTIFELGNTIGGQLPTSLNLVYNTNDIILNTDYGVGIGMKLNFH